ncbi:TolC family protein [Pelobacter propionicus]|uniref:Outer membrane efflux protein n=1 Tax=Pelobacter propionicus (strain DSM 2379 / NBRC 103807 / OttBd1) TaxID=338966 RepID=A0R7N0_PELPD|nr:TolC family protein [Pelobacter propionicus]ABL01240.1 outer membrane efflux protein [Pelobacter propionicus DSM 2379]
MKRLRTLVLLILMFVPSALTWAEEPKLPAEDLASLVDTAITNNPELKSSQARWQMFRNRIAQARSFDDPMLMLKLQNGLVNSPFNFRRDSMTQKVIGLSQQIPFWGKRGLKEEVAANDAESYRWQVDERRLELARMVKETYYQIFFADRSLEIVAKNIRILDDFITLAETKYAVGQGAQQDIFKSQVERSKMLDMKISLEQERKSLVAALNALLYRSPETAVGRIPDFEIQPLPLSARDLRETALKKRPMIKSLQALIDKGEAGRRLARKEFYPDFNVSLEYMQREPAMGSDGADMYSLGVTFNLPVRRERRHAMVAESNSEISMATEELNGLRNTIDSGISDLLAKLEKREKLVMLFKTGIIPQAEQSLESATIGYRVNKVDFLSLLDSRVTLFNYERELYESQAEYMMGLAQLEALVGTDPAMPQTGPGKVPTIVPPVPSEPEH